MSFTRHVGTRLPWLADGDVYSVIRSEDARGRVFLVAHYPSREATAACCTAKVHQRAGETDTETLARADALIEQQHAQRR